MSDTTARSKRDIAMGQVQPTGRVSRDVRGLELIVSRRIPAPAGEAWAWVTDPSLVKQWFGSFRAVPKPGSTFSVKLLAEEGHPSVRMGVLECIPGERYVVETVEADDVWHLTISVADLGGASMVFLAHRLETAREAGSIGPGWEYYLDRMLAARSGGAMPDFDDYFPSQKPYYERLAMNGDPVAWPAS
jgi:uncharacterized protein YndB with AHSA1/START domain